MLFRKWEDMLSWFSHKLLCTAFPCGTSSTTVMCLRRRMMVVIVVARRHLSEEKNHEQKVKVKLPPVEPVGCCMSGCYDCVWVQYAQDLLDYYKDGGQKTMEIISQMDNENLKTFLKLELKTKGIC
ncbi:oxidoreductase-like domain-containing protein 1 [Tachypleus tridentatus]|uniref:oxidoreductase-like domain-containing protein 1 n=1 Tax=Tachypleus tridentatus TaxID=6853 RepID=UPI003FD2B472